jgi:hypothetical protein
VLLDFLAHEVEDVLAVARVVQHVQHLRVQAYEVSRRQKANRLVIRIIHAHLVPRDLPDAGGHMQSGSELIGAGVQLVVDGLPPSDVLELDQASATQKFIL